jgi:NAD+ kinase
MTSQNDKKRIILIGNPDKPQSRQLGRKVLGWMRNQAHVVGDNIENSLELTDLPEADYVVVLGGDGTILSTVRSLGGNQIPIIGVNIGKLGFLAEFSAEQLKEHFSRLVSDRQLISDRVMLQCRIAGPDRPQDYVTTAVNELAIIAGPPFRMIEASIQIAQEHLAVCAGDGLLVATPTGSTAYNLSAGGPILMATLEAAVITPLAAHSLSFRPVVVDLANPIILRCHISHAHHQEKTPDKNQRHGSVIVAVDGQVNIPLQKEDEVIISRSDARFLLVSNPQQGQWRLLNTKLNWGALPNYG